MKRSQLIRGAAAMAFACGFGALVVVGSGETADARHPSFEELSIVLGGQQCWDPEGEFHEDRTCNATQTCHHLNYPSTEWCGSAGQGVGQECNGCVSEGYVDHTCLTGGTQDCQVGGSAGENECGKKTVGTCSPSLLCTDGEEQEDFCPCDARKCEQQ